MRIAVFVAALASTARADTVVTLRDYATDKPLPASSFDGLGRTPLRQAVLAHFAYKHDRP